MAVATVTLTVTVNPDLVEAKLDEFPEQLGNWVADSVQNLARNLGYPVGSLSSTITLT